MKLSALLVDDEADSRSVLSSLLGSFCPEVAICGEAGDVDTAYELIISKKPQVVFLDIQMPGGNGFALLKRFTEIPFEIIFVTSYNEYAIDAIRFSALDYLLKPIEVSDLQNSVASLQKTISKKRNSQRQIINLITNMENKGLEKKIAVHHNDMVVFIPIDDINCMEGIGNYTMIRTGKGEKYTSSKNLGEFEELLRNCKQFLRISKSCIVNLNHVTNYSKGEKCMLFISGDLCFDISRRKKQELLDRMKSPL